MADYSAFANGAGGAEGVVASSVTATNSNFSPESFSGLFEPDVILPDQFIDTRNCGLGGGERKLMAAILADGVEAYIAQVTAEALYGRQSVTEATEWVNTKDHGYVFSFDMVCESLGINAEYLRLGLARYVEKIKLRGEDGVQPSSWKKIRRPRK